MVQMHSTWDLVSHIRLLLYLTQWPRFHGERKLETCTQKGLSRWVGSPDRLWSRQSPNMPRCTPIHPDFNVRFILEKFSFIPDSNIAISFWQFGTALFREIKLTWQRGDIEEFFSWNTQHRGRDRPNSGNGFNTGHEQPNLLPCCYESKWRKTANS